MAKLGHQRPPHRLLHLPEQHCRQQPRDERGPAEHHRGRGDADGQGDREQRGEVDGPAGKATEEITPLMEICVDDYLVAPFHPAVVRARVVLFERRSYAFMRRQTHEESARG